ncbi:hypothetical protein HYPSUDRAFT_678680 [Hypholoma sublateritium FD-334 SS-4]|uniref:F-box domain-containing protein n=1 Tax=Hypholoma sublateritium (strain FD-334 SS-4) TaxID=945553 RepID=A0A0D2NSE9_HYPSF|nr:hypothetical protein HYPSUDRAFT_678680 [Hypholoma sublateritium FD-334 SS-4]
MASSTYSLNFLDLPAELLVEISSYLDSPTILASVCKDLSNMIHSTPSLWSCVSVGERQHSADDVVFLRNHLERGKSCPLHVSIRATGSLKKEMKSEFEIWSTLSTHEGRICSLIISTDTLVLSGIILCEVLLTPLPVILPRLRKLDVRHNEGSLLPIVLQSAHPLVLFEPIPSMFPSLTTLVLAHLDPCIPNISAPLLSLETLILDGSMSWSCDSAGLYRVVQLLEMAPRLETLWLKDHQLYTGHDVRPISVLRPDMCSAAAPIQCPVVLPRLTRLAVTAPGFGVDLLHTIAAPLLQDLHLDAIRDEGYFGEASWTETYLQMLCASLRLLAVRSPGLRRLALLGIYLTRATWEWLFGCAQGEVPFPLLESIALREIAAEQADMRNVVDNSLLEMYAKVGRISLRRFAYLASEPLLSGVALCRLAELFVEKRADGAFELEIDGETSDEVKEHLGLLPVGLQTILHSEPFRRKEWWTLGQGIDPTERDSY